MTSVDPKVLEALPPSTMYRRMDFDHAQVVQGIAPKTYFLIVSGKKPWASIEVELVPLIYIKQPDDWGIEVIGCDSGIGLPVEVPYSVVLEVTEYLGKQGIEVIGAKDPKKIPVP